MPADESRPASIAVFHLNQIGDLVFSLPALAALRSGFPDARIISVLKKAVAPLLEESPLIDERLTHRGSRDFLDTANRLRAAGIDLAVCLSESPRSRLLASLSRAPQRIGLDGGPLASLLSTGVEKVGLPSTRNNLRVVRALGCPVPSDSYVGLLGAGEADRRGARGLLEEAGLAGNGDRLVVLAPEVSKGREAKSWPAERFGEVAKRLRGRPGTVALIVGADAGSCFDETPEGCLDLGGRTSLRQLLGLLSMADLFVGNDSGVLHLAACLGLPCVALFGPTDPEETGPHGGPHEIVRAPDGVMKELPVEAVWGPIERRLAIGRSSGSPEEPDER